MSSSDMRLIPGTLVVGPGWRRLLYGVPLTSERDGRFYVRVTGGWNDLLYILGQSISSRS